jgi:lipopolysaccharide export system permease protein
VRIADKYILKEFAVPLLAGLALFLFALIMDRVVDLLDLVLNRGISVTIVARLIFCLLPSIIAIALPMSTLLAAVMSFGRMAHDRELLAFKGAGVSLSRLTAPVAAAGLLFSLILVVFNGSVLPEATAAYKQLFITIIRQRATIAFREHTFVREFDGYLLYFDKKESSDGSLRKVYVVETPPYPARVITAQTGRLHVDPKGYNVKLVLEDGVMDQPSDIIGQDYSRIEFARYEVNLDINQALRGDRLFVKGLDEMSYRELWANARKMARFPVESRPFQVVFHQRLALAFAPLFVIFIGVPLGSLARRGGGVGVFISLVVIMVYYSLLMMGRGYADRGLLPVMLAMWIPNIFLSFTGAFAFLAASREAQWVRWGR